MTDQQRSIRFADDGNLVQEKIIEDFTVKTVLFFPSKKSYMEVGVQVGTDSPLLSNSTDDDKIKATLLLERAYANAKELLEREDPTNELLPLLGGSETARSMTILRRKEDEENQIFNYKMDHEIELSILRSNLYTFAFSHVNGDESQFAHDFKVSCTLYEYVDFKKDTSLRPMRTGAYVNFCFLGRGLAVTPLSLKKVPLKHPPITFFDALSDGIVEDVEAPLGGKLKNAKNKMTKHYFDIREGGPDEVCFYNPVTKKCYRGNVYILDALEDPTRTAYNTFYVVPAAWDDRMIEKNVNRAFPTFDESVRLQLHDAVVTERIAFGEEVEACLARVTKSYNSELASSKARQMARHEKEIDSLKARFNSILDRKDLKIKRLEEQLRVATLSGTPVSPGSTESDKEAPSNRPGSTLSPVAKPFVPSKSTSTVENKSGNGTPANGPGSFLSKPFVPSLNDNGNGASQVVAPTTVFMPPLPPVGFQGIATIAPLSSTPPAGYRGHEVVASYVATGAPLPSTPRGFKGLGRQGGPQGGHQVVAPSVPTVAPWSLSPPPPPPQGFKGVYHV